MKYLNELIGNELPKNCIFDKGRVGCGGTTIALENDENYVIAVPFVSLVENKLAQYPNERRKEPILGVYAGVTTKEIKEYLHKAKVKKIVVTYDSLYKVERAVDPKMFNLLVDEYHILFHHYSFRREAVQSVLSLYKNFKSYTFMTATVLEDEFVLDELKDLPIKRVEWPDVTNVKVTAIKCEDVFSSTVELVKSYLSGLQEGNCYLFVNSVDFIKDVVSALKLTEDNCRVIYSKNNKKDVGIHNGTTMDAPKKVNLLTSTVFEGSDIYDENGRTYIISNPAKISSLLYISTQVQQICGRVRNSKYIGEITHLYSTTQYPDISYEEYKLEVEKNIEVTKKTVEWFNSGDYECRKKAAPSSKEAVEGYLQLNDNYEYEFDANKVKLDLYDFKVNRGIYSCRVYLEEEYKKCKIDVISKEESICIKKEKEIKETFKEVIEYLKDNQNSICYRLLLDEACLQYPFIKDAIDILGYERIATLNYVQKDIKEELLILSNKNTNTKIMLLLNKKYRNGFFYSSSEIKKHIQEAYDKVGLTNKKAKASDIETFFNVKEQVKRVNGIPTKGYIIINNK